MLFNRSMPWFSYVDLNLFVCLHCILLSHLKYLFPWLIHLVIAVFFSTELKHIKYLSLVVLVPLI